MDNLPRNRLLEFLGVAEEDLRALDEAAGPVVEVPRGGVIRAAGVPTEAIFLLIEGWVTSSFELAGGQRQIVKIHLPGDLLGAPSMALRTTVETLAAITPARVAPVPLTAFGAVFHRVPRLAAAMFFSAQQERVILMERIAAIGRLPATRRIAALLLHLYDRLRVLDPAQPPLLELPLTQEQLGDILGITSVHVNRTLRELERNGLIRRDGSRFAFDVAELRAFSGMGEREWVREPEWLRAPD